MALGDGFAAPDIWRMLLWSTLVDVARPADPHCPVTLAQGTHDWVAMGQTPRFLLLIRGARFRPLPFAGHAPMSDVPDRLVQMVRDTAAQAV
jgi:pimeloyl-ACP methyl ester carboxylesterase